eukprot:6200339-Pleurochrysis_carterae.AAC.2
MRGLGSRHALCMSFLSRWCRDSKTLLIRTEAVDESLSLPTQGVACRPRKARATADEQRSPASLTRA